MSLAYFTSRHRYWASWNRRTRRMSSVLQDTVSAGPSPSPPPSRAPRSVPTSSRRTWARRSPGGGTVRSERRPAGSPGCTPSGAPAALSARRSTHTCPRPVPGAPGQYSARICPRPVPGAVPRRICPHPDARQRCRTCICSHTGVPGWPLYITPPARAPGRPRT